MPELNGWRDPFDVPAHLIPPAVIYQWCAHEVLGESDPHYQQMLQGGWIPVPRLRHADYFGDKYDGGDGTIQYGGQVLMERPRTDSSIAREREIDDACRNAHTGRLVVVPLTIPVNLTAEELQAAKGFRMAGSEYAAKQIQLMTSGVDPDVYLRGQNGALKFDVLPQRVLRRARWRALTWLFNLISIEELDNP